MTKKAKEIILSIAKMDKPNTSDMEYSRLVAFLDQINIEKQERQLAYNDRVVSRAEAAQLLRVSPMTVSTYARHGLIKSVGGGKKRAHGYSYNSIKKMIGGCLNSDDDEVLSF